MTKLDFNIYIFFSIHILFYLIGILIFRLSVYCVFNLGAYIL